MIRNPPHLVEGGKEADKNGKFMIAPLSTVAD